MIPGESTLRDQALDWLVKTGDPGFEDWDEFTQWLERSPAHADAYHKVASDVTDLDGLLGEAANLQSIETISWQRRTPVRWAVVASFAALAATYFLAPAFTSDAYSTVPGQTRTIALGNGDQLILNGQTQVRVSGLDRREFHLDQGQILLNLASEKNVEVVAGDLSFVDIGTVFEVTRQGRSTRLLVEEGAVRAEKDGTEVTVKAGEMIESNDADRQLKPSTPTDAAAGGWVSGQLSYFDAPLDLVATDLRRSTGLAFSPTAAMSRRRFSGTLSVEQIRKNPSSLGPLLSAKVYRIGENWMIEEGG